MKGKPLWKISVAATAEAEEAVAELLLAAYGRPPSSYTDLESGEVTVSVFLSRPPGRFRAGLRRGLEGIRRCGLQVGPGTIIAQRLAARDWAESWKRHFKPVEIDSDLLIKPSWSKRRARKGQAVIILDPGLSFGTGQHPTTAFCLRQLVVCRNRAIRQAVLDIGAGSGILAIAAAKLDYSPVRAFDFDPVAVRVARANSRRNRVHRKTRFLRVDLRKLPRRSVRQYDLICANLVSSLLISERDRLITRLKPQGRLVVAGILKSEFSKVIRAFRSAGLKLIASRVEKEWRSGAFAAD